MVLPLKRSESDSENLGGQKGTYTTSLRFDHNKTQGLDNQTDAKSDRIKSQFLCLKNDGELREGLDCAAVVGLGCRVFSSPDDWFLPYAVARTVRCQWRYTRSEMTCDDFRDPLGLDT